MANFRIAIMAQHTTATTARHRGYHTLLTPYFAAMGLAAGAAFLRAQTPIAPSDVPSARASALLSQGLAELSSHQYLRRQHGTKLIQAALTMQLRAIIHAGGPERAARLIKILKFNINLDNWTVAVLKLPQARRAAMFEWGIQPEVLPLVGAAFSARPDVRASSAAGLAKIPGANSDWMLRRLLADSHRLVYLSTLAALWDRQPSARIVAIIFHRAVGGNVNFNGLVTRRIVPFNGHKIVVVRFSNYWQQVQDGQYAVQLLVHWHPTELKTLLVTLTQKFAGTSDANNILQRQSMMQGRNFIALFRLYKPAAAAPYLLNLIGRPETNEINFVFNGQNIHWDNRTIPLYLLTLLTGHKPQHYHFFKTALYGGSWLFNTRAQEHGAIKEMREFWKKRGVTPIPEISTSAARPATTTAPATRAAPATLPAAIPASRPMPPHG